MRALVFGLIALVLAAGAAGLVGVSLVTHTADRLADELVPADEANRAVLQDLTDAETGIRGWGATGNRIFLQPYNEQQRRLQVRAVERKLAEDAGRPIIFYASAASCWQPAVKGLTLMVNSVFRSYRFEDIWLDR